MKKATPKPHHESVGTDAKGKRTREAHFTLKRNYGGYILKCNRNLFSQSLEYQRFPAVTLGYTFCNRGSPKIPQSFEYQGIAGKLRFPLSGRQSVTVRGGHDLSFPLSIKGFGEFWGFRGRLHFGKRSVTGAEKAKVALSLGSQGIGAKLKPRTGVTLGEGEV